MEEWIWYLFVNGKILKKSRNIEPVLINNKMYFIDKNLYEDLLNDIKSNYIPTQKIKDKIERIQEEGYWLFTTDRDSDKCVEILQELLGGNNE